MILSYLIGSHIFTIFNKWHRHDLIIGLVVDFRLCRGSLALCVWGRWLLPPASRVACLPVLARLALTVLIQVVVRSARTCRID